jgi:hypothetical protein
MIPTTLAGWTLDVIEGLLARKSFESETFDFKSQLPHKSDKAGKLNLRKQCCAFANSEGGFLIYGIADDRTLPATKRLVGMPAVDDFPLNFGDYPKECIPQVYWAFSTLQLPGKHDQLIHVVHLPHSWRGPHVVADDQKDDLWYFPKRTNKGVEPMSYEEVRMAFTGQYERRRKLRLLREELGRLKLQAPTFMQAEEAANILNHDAGELRLTIIEGIVNDSFLILEERLGLLADLGIVRQLATQINHATARYFQQQMRLPIGKHSPYMLKQHNINVQNWSNELIRHADRCIQEIDQLAAG